MSFTKQAKLRAVRREIRQRRRVYPRLIASGKMTQQEADAEIAVMEAIAADYAAPTLFSSDNAGATA